MPEKRLLLPPITPLLMESIEPFQWAITIPPLILAIPDTDLFVEGNVGIGTTSPTEKLTIRDPNIAVDAASGEIKFLFDSCVSGGAIGFAKETFNTGGLRFYTQYI